MTVFIIDSSSLIRAWVESYPRDSFPTLWQNIRNLVTSNRLIISEEVVNELKKKDDGLCKWINDNASIGIVQSDESIMHEVAVIIDTYRRIVKPYSKRGEADPFVVAVAKLRNAIVVSEEKDDGSDKSSNQRKIPWICKKENIQCINILELIRIEKWRF